MNSVLFSIITVCYNSENTLGRTIESVLAQDGKDFEYIIIDGASTDSTIDIIKSYEPLFEGRMKWISEHDDGIYCAMNKGINHSSGEIIGIVNSDDWLEPDTLQYLRSIIDTNPSLKQSILAGEVLFHYSDGATQHFSTSRESYERLSKKYRMGLNHPATFVPRIIYERVGVFDEKFNIYADADFVLRCHENDVPVYFINKVLSNMEDGGASNTKSKTEFSDTMYKYKKHVHSKPLYCCYCLKCIAYLFVKRLVSDRFIRYYRRVNN